MSRTEGSCHHCGDTASRRHPCDGTCAVAEPSTETIARALLIEATEKLKRTGISPYEQGRWQGQKDTAQKLLAGCAELAPPQAPDLRAAAAALLRGAETGSLAELHAAVSDVFGVSDGSDQENHLFEAIMAGLRLTGLRAATPPPASADADLRAAARDVLAERERQMAVEAWTPDHDDQHRDGQLSGAAACYALYRSNVDPQIVMGEGLLEIIWPWSSQWWKPTDRRRDLVKAGALILAEIERLDRAALTPRPDAEGGAV